MIGPNKRSLYEHAFPCIVYFESLNQGVCGVWRGKHVDRTPQYDDKRLTCGSSSDTSGSPFNRKAWVACSETSAKTYARAGQVPAHRHKAAQYRQDNCIGAIRRCRAAALCAYRASVHAADYGGSSVICPWPGNTSFDAIPSTMIHLRS